MERAVDEFGWVDIPVNNAGINIRKEPHELSPRLPPGDGPTLALDADQLAW